MKIIFLAHRPIYFSQLLKPNLLSEIIYSPTQTVFLFEFCNNNSRIKCKICSKLKREARDVLEERNFEYTWHVSSAFLATESDLGALSRCSVTFKRKLLAAKVNNVPAISYFLSKIAQS